MLQQRSRDISWFISWSSIQKVGNLRVVHYSYLTSFGVPLIAFAINYVNSILGVERIQLSINLLIFYLGSVSASLATLLFDIFCPGIIREFPSAERYAQHLRGIVALDAEVRKVVDAHEDATIVPKILRLINDQDQSSNLAFAREALKRIKTEVETSLQPGEDESERDESARVSLLQSYSVDWTFENTRRYACRVAVAALYTLAGLIATYYLLCYGIWQVVGAI